MGRQRKWRNTLRHSALYCVDQTPAHAGLACAMMPGQQEKNGEDAMHHTLVPSDRVEHANVYGRDGTKLGTIERLMLDKVRGTVAYAVIKTGGLLASHHHYPVRWDVLRFDPECLAFRVD